MIHTKPRYQQAIHVAVKLLLPVVLVICWISVTVLRRDWGKRTLEPRHVHRGIQETDLVRSTCGTRDPQERDFVGRDLALSYIKFKRQIDKRGHGYEANSPKIIPVCFHAPQESTGIVNRLFGRYKYTDEYLQKQLDHLNHAFSKNSCCDFSQSWCTGQCSAVETNIRFAMARRNLLGKITGITPRVKDRGACVTRKYGRRWTMMNLDKNRPFSYNERRIKEELRKGDAGTLNVYFILPNLHVPGRAVIGAATFPWWYTNDRELDGVVIHPESMAGGRVSSANEGDTLVHEVGHWLGLYHTFQSGCSPGDHVLDTAAEAQAHKDCTPGTDTCPFQDGLDPIHNFMDFSSDACLFEWTQGQVDVMHANLEAYRSGGSPLTEPIALVSGVHSDSFTVGTRGIKSFTLVVPSLSEIFCDSHAPVGNYRMYLSWESLFGDTDCLSSKFGMNKTCLSTAGSGTLHVWISARAATIDATIRCSIVDMAAIHSLMNGVPSTPMDIGSGVLVPMKLTVDYDLYSVECTTRAASGDIDLFVGSSAPNFVADCYSTTKSSSTETCIVGQKTANHVDVLVLSTAATTGVTVTCDAAAVPVTELLDGVQAGPYSLSASSHERFFIEVPDPLSIVVCSAIYSDGIIGFGLSWDGSLPEDSTCGDTCYLEPGHGKASVYPYALEPVSSYNFTCTIDTPTELAHKVPYAASAQPDQYKLFTIAVNDIKTVTCYILTDVPGDLDLLMNWDGVFDEYDCISERSDSNELCTIGPNNGTAYAFVYSYDVVSNYTVTCRINP